MLAPVFLLAKIVSSMRLNPVVDIVTPRADLPSPGRVSHKLLVNKTEKAVVGQPLELTCSLPTRGELELCTWTRSGGTDDLELRRQTEEISLDIQDRK